MRGRVVGAVASVIMAVSVAVVIAAPAQAKSAASTDVTSSAAAVVSGAAAPATATVSLAAAPYAFRVYSRFASDGTGPLKIAPAATTITFVLPAIVASMASIRYGLNRVSGSAPVTVSSHSITIPLPPTFWDSGATSLYFSLSAHSTTTAPPSQSDGANLETTSDYSAFGDIPVDSTSTATSFDLSAANAVEFAENDYYSSVDNASVRVTAGTAITVTSAAEGLFTSDPPIDNPPIFLGAGKYFIQSNPTSVSADGRAAVVVVPDAAAYALGDLGVKSAAMELTVQHTLSPAFPYSETDITIPLTIANAQTIDYGEANYIAALYHDYLNRSPARSEVVGWAQAFQRGAPRTAVADGFAGSDEYRLLRINAAYQSILHRQAEPGGPESWLRALQTGLLSTDDIERNFYDSAEYYSTECFNNDEVFVSALFATFFDRSPSNDDTRFWEAVTSQHGRDYVVARLYSSPEAASRRVTDMYEQYLGRAPEAAGLANWVGYVANHNDAQLRSALTSSDEYFARATENYGG